MSNIEQLSVNDFSEIDPEHYKTSFMDDFVPKKKAKYIDKRELYEAFVRYAAKKKAWQEAGKEGVPPLSNEIGEAIMKVCKKFIGYYKFSGYTKDWKEEMVDDAIESCVKYCHNFDPEKSDNPFGYLTMIAYNSFLQRIKKEKNELYIKYKMFDRAGGFQAVSDLVDEEHEGVHMNEVNDVYKGYLEFIENFERKPEKPPKEEVVDETKLEF